jgi:hypothetical protein
MKGLSVCCVPQLGLKKGGQLSQSRPGKSLKKSHMHAEVAHACVWTIIENWIMHIQHWCRSPEPNKILMNVPLHFYTNYIPFTVQYSLLKIQSNDEMISFKRPESQTFHRQFLSSYPTIPGSIVLFLPIFLSLLMYSFINNSTRISMLVTFFHFKYLNASKWTKKEIYLHATYIHCVPPKFWLQILSFRYCMYIKMAPLSWLKIKCRVPSSTMIDYIRQQKRPLSMRTFKYCCLQNVDIKIADISTYVCE